MDEFDIWDLLGDPSAFGLLSGNDIFQPLEPIDPGFQFTPGLLQQLQLPNTGSGPSTTPISSLPIPATLPGLNISGGSTHSPTGGSSNLPKSPVNSLLDILGLGGGALSAILPLLGTVGAGLLNRNNVNHATDQVIAGLNNASSEASRLLGPFASTSGAYAPYLAAGEEGIKRLTGMNSNIASRYQPLGSGRGMVTLGQLAGK